MIWGYCIMPCLVWIALPWWRVSRGCSRDCFPVLLYICSRAYLWEHQHTWLVQCSGYCLCLGLWRALVLRSVLWSGLWWWDWICMLVSGIQRVVGILEMAWREECSCQQGAFLLVWCCCGFQAHSGQFEYWDSALTSIAYWGWGVLMGHPDITVFQILQQSLQCWRLVPLREQWNILDASQCSACVKCSGQFLYSLAFWPFLFASCLSVLSSFVHQHFALTLRLTVGTFSLMTFCKTSVSSLQALSSSPWVCRCDGGQRLSSLLSTAFLIKSQSMLQKFGGGDWLGHVLSQGSVRLVLKDGQY